MKLLLVKRKLLTLCAVEWLDWFNVFAAFVSGITGHSFWCGVNIVLAVLMAFLAIAYEGRLINRIQKLEREIDDLKRRMTYGS